ncbi:hypothetical protein ACIRRH_28345 [Kitasatospora sp. NPDC101235]|uniref:hypothetical protein n=1 Tax=Kitasatospora sp. NPDC101235 TaxID=3364101 RepID=UPI0038132B7F
MTVPTDASPRGPTGTEAARLPAERGRSEAAADRRVPRWARVAAQLRDPLITVLPTAVPADARGPLRPANQGGPP